MRWIALRMLTGNRSKYFSIVFGLAFAVMLMSQQASIFVGLMRNTASQIRDMQGADIWVMDPSVEFVDDVTPLPDNALYRIRGVPGVAWAQRLYKGLARAQFQDGNFKQFIVLGVDDQSLVGAPAKMLVGSLADLRRPDAVVIDEMGFRFLWPGEPLQAGKSFEMNDHRAQSSASARHRRLSRHSRSSTRAIVRRLTTRPRSGAVVRARQAQPGVSTAEVCQRIQDRTGLLALSNQDFAWATISYYMRRTGIPINFGTTVLLGFIIGAAIAGQTFYLFTVANLKQFGALKAMGVTNRRLVGMVLLQGMFVGAIGYCLGLGLASLMETILAMRLKTIPLMNYMAWQIPLGTAVAVALIVLGTTFISLRRVLLLEPASVFK